MSDYSKEYQPIDNIECHLGAIEGELDSIRDNINLLIEQYKNRKEQMNKDAVSREAVLDAIKNNYRMAGIDVIEKLPPVTPARQKGEWEKANDSWLVCSECGFAYNSKKYSVLAYCPWCGEYMGGGEQK